MAKATVTVDVDYATQISVVATPGDGLMIMVGGEAETKFALLMPGALADVLSARISAARIDQLSDKLVGDFKSLSQATAGALVAAAEARLTKESQGETASDNVVSIDTRRQP
jgi:hypothetical protein